MISSKFDKKSKLFIRFILSIKPKITNNNNKIINKRLKIGFSEIFKKKYIYSKNKEKKEKIFTTYIFEIIDKTFPKNFWVFKENTTFHYDDYNK